MPLQTLHLKKVLSYIFLLLFLYSAIGYYPFFLLHQNVIRKEIKQRIKNSIPANELFVFSFSEEEYRRLDWEKEDKEFHCANSMYDIVRKSADENGNITLYCINDFRESQLFVNLEEQVQKSSSGGKNAFTIFKLLANISFPAVWSLIVLTESEINFYPFLLPFSFFFHEKIPSPPPELV